MSYDVIVTETVGEISKEYKFKDYQNFLDWELQGKVVNKEATKVKLPEIEGELIKLTKENVRDLVSEGDTVFIKGHNKLGTNYGDTTKPYIVEYIEDLDYDGYLLLDLNRGNSWVDFSDDQLEIYKVIKN